MGKRLVLFLILLASILTRLMQAGEKVDTSFYPPEQLVWLRIHDYNATLPQSILTLHTSLINDEQLICRSKQLDAAKQALLVECRALYRALTDINHLAAAGAFGDWSFILPIHELREWYALVVLHHQLQRALADEPDMVAATILRALYEAYVCRVSDGQPPYIIITDRKGLVEVLKSLLAEA